MVRDLKVHDLMWEPHPSFKGLMIKKILTHEKENVDITIIIIKARKGTEVPVHVHEQDDIVYQLEGKSKMWVEGEGDFELLPGSFIRIPAGIKHQPHDFQGDVLVFDIFLPHLF